MTEHPSRFGAGLRCQREQSGLTLRQIAESTKLATRVLQALEDDRVDQLPTGIYRRAVVRAYASEVGLDPEATLRAFLATYPDGLPALPPPVKPSFDNFPPLPEPPPRFALLPAVLSVIGALVPIVAGILYFTLVARGADAPSHVVDLAPGPGTPSAAEVIPAAFGEPSLPARAVAMMISVSSATSLEIVADGRPVLRRPVRAGEVLRVTLSEEVRLVADDAGAVHFSINGQAGRALGRTGAALDVRIARDDYQAYLIQP